MAENLNRNVTDLGPVNRELSSLIVSSTNEIAGLPGVERVVLLPDVHLKEKYVRAGYKATVPSSAVITSSTELLYPQFRSRGLGCGMMLVGTGVLLGDSAAERRRVLRALPGFWTNDASALDCARIGNRNSFAMSPGDMLQMNAHGAPWVAEQFGLSADALGGFFRGGSFFSAEESGQPSWEGLSEDWIAGRRRDGRQLGLDLGGNHFLEAQVVHDVPRGTPDRFLEAGELVFLYHGACNGLASVLRPDLAPALAERECFVSFGSGAPEYDLVLRAVKMLLNWSAASRCLVLARLRRLLSRCFRGVSLERLRCVSEAPHNSILVEHSPTARRIVYRHNAVPIEPGRPTIVSGRNDHLSYLFLPGPEPERSLCTLDHGVGAILGLRPAREHSTTGAVCRRIERRYLRGRPLWHRHRDCALIDPASTEPSFRQSYEEAGLTAGACYRLRPLATLKRGDVSLRHLPLLGGSRP